MEKQFKKLLQKTHNLNDPLMKTFEGDLFAQSAWFFQTEDDEITIEKFNHSIAHVKNEMPRNEKNYLTEVLFVGDSFSGESEDLLGKMISAMKLTTKEFKRYSFEEELENISDLEANLANPTEATQRLLNFILENRPKVVVSLGATLTNIILGKREKLSGIHGQFIDKSFQSCDYKLMPIFHPDFLMINPNMKRTAWIDLQKVMEFIGKI